MLFPDVAVPDVAILEELGAVEALLGTDLRLHLCMPMRIFSLFSPRCSSDNKSLPIQIPLAPQCPTLLSIYSLSLFALLHSQLSLWLFFKFDTNIREVSR